MGNKRENSDIEARIYNEIIVDAYDEIEQAMGWYYYLADNLNFPFKANWRSSKRSSKLKVVEVIGMSEVENCEDDMFVDVRYGDGDEEDIFSARLSDIEAIDPDEKTAEALDDWDYWIS